MSTHMPGFQSFIFRILHHLALTRLANSSIRVKINMQESVTTELL